MTKNSKIIKRSRLEKDHNGVKSLDILGYRVEDISQSLSLIRKVVLVDPIEICCF